MSPKARVTRDLVDLLPQFLRRRAADIESLRAALANEDAAALRALGERMVSVGNPYGFKDITALGRQVIEASLSAELDPELFDSLIAQYADYLKAVQIVHIDVPAPTWKNVPLVAAQA